MTDRIRKDGKTYTKLDRNHRAIVLALKAVGASVQSLASVGRGVPDLLVGYRQTNYLLEVKNPLNPRASLTACQVRWIEAWQGQVAVVVTPEQALLAIGCTPQEIQAYETADMLRRRRDAKQKPKLSVNSPRNQKTGFPGR